MQKLEAAAAGDLLQEKTQSKEKIFAVKQKQIPFFLLLSKEILKMASKTRLSLTLLVVLIKNLRLPFPLVVNPERRYKGT